ncbi:MAG: ATP-binding protein [Melioribacteraceae bacterium]|nr:ATP-binding protein [Melioribacteraceae bacterium]
MPFYINQISIIVTILASVGLIYILYSRGFERVITRLFVLTLILIIGYIISHAIHFMMVIDNDLTLLDQACHSFLLLILVALTFFSYYFPHERRMNVFLKIFILLPSLILLFMLWYGKLIIDSHLHAMQFEAHYTKYYPLFLSWYVLLLLLNAVWLIRKIFSTKNQDIKKQLLLLLTGVIITNFTAFLVGLYLPWMMGFYYLVELSPLAFLVGIISFTTIAVGKYNMFPMALNKLHSFSVTKKTIFAALIIVPIIVITIQLPLIRLFFGFEDTTEWQKYFIISFFGGLIVSVSMTFMIVKLIAEPLKKLKDKALEIKKGNYGIKVDSTSNDEIGELVETFNDMSITLEKDSIELKQKEKRISMLLTAFETSNAAIAIVDSKNRVIEVNDKFTKIVELPKNEIIQSPIKDVQFSGNLNREYEKIQNALKQNETFEGEMIIHVNGKSRTILLTVTPFGYKDNDIDGYLMVEVDITELKGLELKLAESEKLAALGKMAAILAHEIKTPLTSIKMNSDILYESLELNSDDQTSFQIIKKEIERLNHLVKDVLQFSRKIDVVKTEFNLYSFVEEVFSNMKIKATKKNFRMINKNNDKMLFADFDKLKQVFINLLENAYEAAADNGQIIISSTISENNIIVNFEDNGNGINDEIRSKIFEPFYTSKASGTGLGLAVSKKIIEEHNGNISLLYSEPGSTVFEISIPQKNKIS